MTSGITRFTRIDDAGLLHEIAYPTAGTYSFSTADWAAMESYRAATGQRLAAAPNLLPGDERHLAFYQSAFATEGLRAYADAIPPEDELEEDERGPNNFGSSLRRQAQLTVLAFKTGVAVSADLYLGGFDTHDNHDADHGWLLGSLTNGVDYLWDYAEAHGVADRLVVVMGSDFGRTNFYNSQSGKDHWPIGSYIVMEKNQRWTNQVVGETDDLHFAYSIAPRTLRRDDQNGTIIYPKHVHKALRRYLGIEHSAGGAGGFRSTTRRISRSSVRNGNARSGSIRLSCLFEKRVPEQDQHDGADEAEDHQSEEPHQPIAYLTHVRVDLSKALFHAPVHVIEAPVHVIEAPVHVIKALIQVIEALVDVHKVLLARLFGVYEPLFHTFLDAERALVHSQDELLEVFLANKFLSHAKPSVRVNPGRAQMRWKFLLRAGSPRSRGLQRLNRVTKPKSGQQRGKPRRATRQLPRRSIPDTRRGNGQVVSRRQPGARPEEAVYPQTVILPNDMEVELWPMTPDDAPALLEFYRALPQEDLLYLREDVTSTASMQLLDRGHRKRAELAPAGGI